jgi:hypothetical protein
MGKGARGAGVVATEEDRGVEDSGEDDWVDERDELDRLVREEEPVDVCAALSG